MEVTEFIETQVSNTLGRYFKIDCSENKQGDVLCAVAFRNARFPVKQKDVKIRISRDHTGDYQYMHAVVENAMHTLLQQITRMR